MQVKQNSCSRKEEERQRGAGGEAEERGGGGRRGEATAAPGFLVLGCVNHIVFGQGLGGMQRGALNPTRSGLCIAPKAMYLLDKDHPKSGSDAACKHWSRLALPQVTLLSEQNQ